MTNALGLAATHPGRSAPYEAGATGPGALTTEQAEGLRRATMIEPVDPDRIDVLNGRPGDKERYIRSDQLIRSGMCPNGHGLMTLGGWGQECPQCGFTCNTLPELREH